MILGGGIVLVDANVLFSRTLRDWVCLLADAEEATPYLLRTTEDILAETLYHLRRKHPSWSGAQIVAVREHLLRVMGDGLITDFPVPPDFSGQDPNDAHVHGAAVACGAHVLLTSDRSKDFAGNPDALPYEIWSSDEFLVLVDDSAPQAVSGVAQRQIDYWMRRRGEVDLPHQLRRAGCPDFAERVRRRLQTL